MSIIKTIFTDGDIISTLITTQVINVSGGAGGGISNIVEDTTPQLGGNLDLNSNNITGTGNITHTGTLTTTGNIAVTGTVDGRDIAADGTKLDGIASGAEVNTVDSVNTQTGAVVLDADDISDTLTTNKFTTAAEISKLAGIEASATADQTGAEIKALYEAEADTNAYTDAEKTKLAGVESSATADQTDAEIETAYNNQVAQVSGAEITAGTSTAIRRYSPADVKSFVDTHSAGGSSVVYFAGYSTQTATITQDTWTDITFAVETIKDSGYTHSTVTNAEQITLDAAGVYLISGNILMETGTIRSDGSCRFQVDQGAGFVDLTGVVGYGVMNSAPFSGPAITKRGMGIPTIAYSAGAGDIIKLQVYIDSAGDWALTSGSSITIQKIS